jgi:MoxR-like ATPase
MTDPEFNPAKDNATTPNPAQSLCAHIQRELGRVLFGQEETLHAVTIALIARGHILLEGPPGLGKTLLGRHFAALLGGRFKRIQGTADLMPADITGVHVWNARTSTFDFQQGPLFADVVLVDEINRAGPKTQSALLEAMEERQVSVDRESFALPDNFIVIATQNPREFEGTYPLPESQLDRFALSSPLTYPPRDAELRIIETYNLPDSQSRREPVALEPVPAGLLDSARAGLRDISMNDALMGYVQDLVTASRDSRQIALGLSTRGALSLARCARVEAALRGGSFVIPDDVKRVAPLVMRHRLVLSPDAMLDGITSSAEVSRILSLVPVPH